MRAALAYREETVARTLDIMDRITIGADVCGQAITEAESRALCILVLVCGELRDPRVHRPLLRLLACDGDKVDRIFGDMITESMTGILISTFDGSTPSRYAAPSGPSPTNFHFRLYLVTHSMVIPSLANPTIVSSASLIISGSSAEVGSSNSMMRGFM